MIRNGLNFARAILKAISSSIRSLRIKVIIPISLLVFGATFGAANASFQPMEYSIVITPDHFPIVFPKRNADGDPVDYGEPKTISAAELLNTAICQASNNCSAEALAAGAVYYKVKPIAGVGDVIFYYDELGNLLGTQKVVELVNFDPTVIPKSNSNYYNPQASTSTAQQEAAIEKAFPTGYTNYVVGSTSASFEVSPSGAANYSIPIAIPPAINGMQPELSINYNSQGGNGLLGVGFSIGGLSAISRCPKTLAQDPELSPRISRAVNYTNDDAFCLDGQRLIHINAATVNHGTTGAEYRTEIETFSRIKISDADSKGPKVFTVETKAGQKFYYDVNFQGNQNINLKDPSDATRNNNRAMLWPVRQIQDISNQTIDFTYSENSDGTTGFRVEEIRYGIAPNQPIIKFNYAARPDISNSYSHGYVFSTSSRLKSINVKVGNKTVRDYAIQYGDEVSDFSSTGKSRIKAIKECVGNQCLPPITFDWTNGPTGMVDRGLLLAGDLADQKDATERFYVNDNNNDGFSDILIGSTTDKYRNNGGVWYEVNSAVDKLNGHVAIHGTGFDSPFAPGWQDSSDRVRLMDLNGDGISTIVVGPDDNGKFFYRGKNTSVSNFSYYESIEINTPFSGWQSRGKDIQVIDLDGDGKQDLLLGPDGSGDFHALISTGSSFTSHPSYINHEKFLDPDSYSSMFSLFSIWGTKYGLLRDHRHYTDVNGDGLVDILIGPNHIGRWDLLKSTGSGFEYHSNYTQSRSTNVGLKAYKAGSGDNAYIDHKWTTDIVSTFITSRTATYDRYNVRFIDVNADGLQDMVLGPRDSKVNSADSGRFFVKLNTGNGFTAEQNWFDSSKFEGWKDKSSRIRPFDVNADGLTDILIGPEGNGNWYWLQSTGTKFIDKGIAGSAQGSYASRPDRIHMGDFDGDGLGDFIFSANDSGNWYGVKLNGGQPDQLVGISNGPTPKTTIEYEYLTRGGEDFYKKGGSAVSTGTEKTITMPMKAVKVVSKGDGLGGTHTTSYAYEDLRVNLRGRGMLGFGKVTSTDSRTGEVLVTEYGQSFPYTGLTLKNEKWVNGHKIETVNKKYAYKITHTGVVYPVNYENISETYEFGHTSPYKRVTVWTGAYENMTPYSNGDPCVTDGYACRPSTTPPTPPDIINLDEYGNILWMKTITEDLGSNQVWSQETTSTYDNDPDTWVLGRLTSSTVIHSNSLGVPDITRLSAFTYDGNGQLKTETVEPQDKDNPTLPNAADPSLSKITTYGYDESTGLKNHVEEQGWDSQGNPLPLRVADTTTDTDNSTFPEPTIKTTVTNGLGESETTWTSSLHGGQLAHVGPNKKRTLTAYDGFGRISSTTDETLNVTRRTTYAWTYNKPLNSIYKITTKTDNIQDDSTVYYDELNREIRTTSRSMDGREVVKETVYNHRGLIEKVNRPYLAYSTPVWLCFAYDDLGRVTDQSMPKAMIGTPDCGPGSIRANTHTDYNGLETTVTVAGKFKKQEKKNVIGKTEWIIDAKDSTDQSRLDYTYYATGELHTVKDALNKVTRLVYDNNGRKKEMHDPAMGDWSYSYNSFDELESQTDAIGNVINMKYDDLGRMTHRNEIKATGGTDQWVWKYVLEADKDATHPVGKLWQVTGPDNYLKTFEYDPVTLKPQKVTERQKLPSGSNETLEQSFTYDGFGRLATQTLPEGLVVENEYNDYGYQVAVKSPSSVSTPEAKAKLQNLVQQTEQKLQQANQRASSYLNQAASYQQKAIEYETYAISVLQREAYTHQVEGEQAAQAAEAEYATNYAACASQPLPLSCRFILKIAFNAQKTQILNEAETKALSLYKAANDLRDISKALIVKANTEKVEAAKAHAAAVNKTDPAKTPSQHRVAAQARVQQASYYLDQARVLVTKLKADGVSVPSAGIFTGAKAYLQTVEDQLNKAQTAYVNAGDQIALAERYENYLTGLNDALSDANQITWWRAITADAEGRVTEATYGNGTTTTRDYDPNTGQLWSIQTSNGVETLQNLSYEYDDLDNVTKRTDHKLNTTETYFYDDLDRLTTTTLAVTGIAGTTTRTREYNEIGDIKKIDGQDLTYDMTTGRMTGSPIQGSDFGYDNNGNQTLSAGRTIDYSIFNKPVRLSKGQDIVEFNYGPDRGRILKVNKTSNILDKTTVYFGGYEKITDFKTQKVTHRYSISAGGALVAVRNVTDGIASNSFMHADALGSTDLITTDQGLLLEHLGYTPFGKRRDLTALNALSDYISLSIYAFSSKAITDRGFTGHEHIDELELIHMNGRVYDPIAGRFLSPDTIVQAPKDTQSYNRYAYVKNNPLKYTDPSGHSWLSAELRRSKKFIKEYGAQIVSIGLAIYLGPVSLGGLGWNPVLVGMISGGAGALIASNGDLGAGIRGAVFGGLAAAATYGIGHSGIPGGPALVEDHFLRGLAHGAAQGVISEMRGGKFKDGFLSGAVGHWSGVGAGKYMESLGGIGTTVVAAMAGGVASVAGGGKFKNGAVTAAFVHLFNSELDSDTQLNQNGDGYYSYEDGTQQYGTSETVESIEKLGRLWNQLHPEGPEIGVGDISYEGGGGMAGHGSHKYGDRVDFRPIRVDGTSSPVRWQDSGYDRMMTQDLVDTIRLDNNVSRILFNDPQIQGVQPFRGHDNHLHVVYKK